ncbi:hypothetical protein EUGRSUZ_F02851 [Eucalyptus grandis]|uniref:Uncharacterized protein n=2 Tax=Eucalyptus grandis TaxID=71139 RepID=A0ACC3KJT4_EUCGR|nr:hypothetical protein EUGRSUZ_F02851 [Eucalyptus grandis]
MAGRPYTPFLVLSLLLLIALSNVAEVRGKLRPSDCPNKCKFRCSATSHKKPCMFFCQKCCAKCLCSALATTTGRPRKEAPNAPETRCSRVCLALS